MRILPCGDEALLVELAGLEEVLGLSAALRAELPAGALEVVPGARTVLVTCRPERLEDVAEAVRRASAAPPEPRGADEVEVPVSYDGEDLGEVAAMLRWTRAELVRRHAAARWTVAFCGFAPGFAYLVAPGWPSVPRRGSPRTRVPAGAVALGGEFSGVYPRDSPGGWRLLGSTRLNVLDLGRDPPALLRPGLRVRFVDTS